MAFHEEHLQEENGAPYSPLQQIAVASEANQEVQPSQSSSPPSLKTVGPPAQQTPARPKVTFRSQVETIMPQSQISRLSGSSEEHEGATALQELSMVTAPKVRPRHSRQGSTAEEQLARVVMARTRPYTDGDHRSSEEEDDEEEDSDSDNTSDEESDEDESEDDEDKESVTSLLDIEPLQEEENEPDEEMDMNEGTQCVVADEAEVRETFNEDEDQETNQKVDIDVEMVDGLDEVSEEPEIPDSYIEKSNPIEISEPSMDFEMSETQETEIVDEEAEHAESNARSYDGVGEYEFAGNNAKADFLLVASSGKTFSTLLDNLLTAGCSTRN